MLTISACHFYYRIYVNFYKNVNTKKKGFSLILKFLLVNSIVQILDFLLTRKILKKRKGGNRVEHFTDQTYKKFGALN